MSIHEHLDALMHSNEALWGKLIVSGAHDCNKGKDGCNSSNSSSSICDDDEVVRSIAEIRSKWKLATAAAKNMFESNMQCVAHIMQMQKEKTMTESAHLKAIDILNNRIQSLLCIVDSQQQEVELCQSTLSLRNLWKRLISSTMIRPSSQCIDHLYLSSSPTNSNCTSSNDKHSNKIYQSSSSPIPPSTSSENGVIGFTDLLENSSTIITLLSLQCSKELKSSSSPSKIISGDSLLTALISKLSVVDKFISDEFNSIRRENLDLRNKIHSKSLQLEQLQQQYSDYKEIQQLCTAQSQEINNLKVLHKRTDIGNNQEIQQMKLRLEDIESKLAASNARNSVLESQCKDASAIAEYWQQTCKQYHDILYANNTNNDDVNTKKECRNAHMTPTITKKNAPPLHNGASPEGLRGQHDTPGANPAFSLGEKLYDNGDNILARTFPIYDSGTNIETKPAAVLPGISLFDNKSIYDLAVPSMAPSMTTSSLMVISDLSTKQNENGGKLDQILWYGEGSIDRLTKLPWDISRKPDIEVKATRASSLRQRKNGTSPLDQKTSNGAAPDRSDPLRSPSSQTSSSLDNSGGDDSSVDHLDDNFDSGNDDVQKAIDYINTMLP